MMKLSSAQIDTLRNLSRKRAGFTTGWVSIAAAQGLTELGLAIRNRSGWEITASGQAALDRQAGASRARSGSVQTLAWPAGRE